MQISNVIVVIATSGDRTSLLINRALLSVYKQIDVIPQEIYIIDDNEKNSVQEIELRVEKLRRDYLLDQFLKIKKDNFKFEDYFHTSVIRNKRTKKHSGTGAWNTGILEAFKSANQDYFIAILDDDDEWKPEYLSISHRVAFASTACVISGIKRIERDNTQTILPSANDFTVSNVYCKNPGLQGSNLYVRLNVLIRLGLFDESLKSTTDRDLLIRLLEYISIHKQQIAFTHKVLVNHYAISNDRVTSDLDMKHSGLDIFYRKYQYLMSKQDLVSSLQRAKTLFQYAHKKHILNKKSTKKKSSQLNTDKHQNIIIGVITDNEEQIVNFLNSFEKLLKKHAIKNQFKYKIVILLNGVNLEINSLLNIEFIYNESRKTIAENRTILQRHIYNLVSKDDVVWITDDDHLFNYFDNIPNYFDHISNLKKEGIDAAIGLVSDNPSLPFLSTVRTQMLDFLHNLKIFQQSNLLGTFQSKASLNQELRSQQDFYYDLSSRNYMHLEAPFYWDFDKAINNKEAFFYFLQETKALANGKNIFRKIEFDLNNFGKITGATIYRGGNTLIFNHELLKVENFTLDPVHYNRRSDFNWCLINKYKYQRDIKEVILPLHHDRSLDILSFSLDKTKLKADIMGLVFYRTFELILQDSPVELVLKNFDEDKNEALLRFRSNLYRTNSLIDEILYILEDGKNWWYEERNLSTEVEQNIAMMKRFKKEFDIAKVNRYLNEVGQEIAISLEEISKLKEEFVC